MILVTGAAGFIGFHLSKRLCQEGITVLGIDNLSDYYDVQLKKDRLKILDQFENFSFTKIDLSDAKGINDLFKSNDISCVINLAAQAGVRYSIENPKVYIDTNIVGFANLIEASKNAEVKNFIYASSSSVYGANESKPFRVNDNVDHPMSLYAASKKSNELIAHSYASLFGLPVTGLRFFTVYGPYGRPDMALFLFTKAILEGKPINVFNNGKMMRDFTYVDDIVESIFRLIDNPAVSNSEWQGTNPSPASSYAPYVLYNIGNNAPVALMDFIEMIEEKTGLKAIKNMMPMQAGDVPETFADTTDLIKRTEFKPSTPLADGVGNFVDWYMEYYNVR